MIIIMIMLISHNDNDHHADVGNTN